MSNFKFNQDGTYNNNCHCQKGTCCCKCKYLVDGKETNKDGSIHKWEACSESCIKNKQIGTCKYCKHNTLLF